MVLKERAEDEQRQQPVPPSARKGAKQGMRSSRDGPKRKRWVDKPVPCKGDGCHWTGPPQWFCLECEGCFCYGCALQQCDIDVELPPCPECRKDKTKKKVRCLTEVRPHDEAAPPNTMRGSLNGFKHEEETGMRCKGCDRGRTHLNRWAGRMISGSLSTKAQRWLAWSKTPMHEYCCAQCAWNFAWRQGYCKQPSGILVHGHTCCRGPQARHPRLWTESNLTAEQRADEFRARAAAEDWLVPPGA